MTTTHKKEYTVPTIIVAQIELPTLLQGSKTEELNDTKEYDKGEPLGVRRRFFDDIYDDEDE